MLILSVRKGILMLLSPEVSRVLFLEELLLWGTTRWTRRVLPKVMVTLWYGSRLGSHASAPLNIKMQDNSEKKECSSRLCKSRVLSVDCPIQFYRFHAAKIRLIHSRDSRVDRKKKTHQKCTRPSMKGRIKCGKCHQIVNPDGDICSRPTNRKFCAEHRRKKLNGKKLETALLWSGSLMVHLYSKIISTWNCTV